MRAVFLFKEESNAFEGVACECKIEWLARRLHELEGAAGARVPGEGSVSACLSAARRTRLPCSSSLPVGTVDIASIDSITDCTLSSRGAEESGYKPPLIDHLRSEHIERLASCT